MPHVSSVHVSSALSRIPAGHFRFRAVVDCRRLAGSFTLGDSLSYSGRNFLLYPPVLSQSTIGTTLPDGEIWNGARWSLPWEAGCYLGVGVLGLAVLRTRGTPSELTLAPSPYRRVQRRGPAIRAGVKDPGHTRLRCCHCCGGGAAVAADRCQA